MKLCFRLLAAELTAVSIILSPGLATVFQHETCCKLATLNRTAKRGGGGGCGGAGHTNMEYSVRTVITPGSTNTFHRIRIQ
jgi:hypothetical protein